MIKTRLRSPTDVKGGSNMRLCPIEDSGDFIPIFHFLKVQMLYGSSGDNHSVIFFVAH